MGALAGSFEAVAGSTAGRSSGLSPKVPVQNLEKEGSAAALCLELPG